MSLRQQYKTIEIIFAPIPMERLEMIDIFFGDLFGYFVFVLCSGYFFLGFWGHPEIGTAITNIWMMKNIFCIPVNCILNKPLSP